MRDKEIRKLPGQCRLGLLVSLLLMSTIAQATTTQNNCEELTLKQAVTASLTGNPDLAAIKTRYESLAAIPSQRSTLPDPVLSLAGLNLPTDTFNLDQENMTQLQIGISQKFPFPGKLKLKEQSAAFEAEAALEQVGEARLNLVKTTRKTWWDIFYLQKSLRIILANQDLLRETVSAARKKYEVGKGLQQDVLLAQVELSRLMDRETSVKNSLEQKKAALAALLDRPPDLCFVLPTSTALTLPETPSVDELRKKAIANRPGLLALKKKIDAAQARIDLARKDYFPDFTLGAAYGFRHDLPDGSARANFATFKLSMNLPVWTSTKQDQAVAQRTSESLTSRHNYRAFRNKVQNEVTTEYSEYTNTMQQTELYRTSLVPQAEQTAAAMLKGYQVNKVDFLNVVRAQLALYNFKITYWKRLSSAFKALAGLEAATGTSVIRESIHE